MTTYHPYGVKLSEGQRKKLTKAYRENSAITIRLSSDELQGNDQLMLTKTQIARLMKAKRMGKGSDIKISKTQIRKVVVEGGSLWSSILSMGTKLLPYATTAISKAVPALATGALSGLADLGVKRIFGEGQVGVFFIPQGNIGELIKYKNILTKKQKEDIMKALQTGGEVDIKPTPTQSGGFLGTLLASIGIPLALKVLTGSGLHVEKSRPRRSIPIYVPPTMMMKKDGGNHVRMMPYHPPPFIGSWDDYKNPIGLGLKKKSFEKKESQRRRSSTRQKQPIQRRSNYRSYFVNKPLSNCDLKNWVKQLGINHFRGVFSRDLLPTQIKNKECGIINLDTYIGPGTHWVAYRNIDRFCEYFDSFGLMMPTEVKKYMATSGKQLEYSGDEIQERDSVLCGYWCLYYLLERQKGRSILDTIHNCKFDMSDKSVNHRFIINYFKNI